MNRRIRNSTRSGSDHNYHKFLKPGALARIRDFKISSSRSPPPGPASPTTIRSPPSSLPSGPLASLDGSPQLSPRIYGPRFLNRKKMVASKRILFSPSSPVPELDSGFDLFGVDLVAAH